MYQLKISQKTESEPKPNRIKEGEKMEYIIKLYENLEKMQLEYNIEQF